jgi:protein TonB
MTFLGLGGLLVVLGFDAAAAPPADEEQGPVVRMPLIPEERLLTKVDPGYPPAAVQLRIQGTVEFNAVIAKDGHVERLRLICGHPLLVRAAREAARQWVYRPVKVFGEPVRVLTKIPVRFQLDPSGKPVKDHNATPNRTAVLEVPGLPKC